MNMKISDYFIDGDWNSFIGKSITDCPTKSYSELLNKYFDLGNDYKIKISYIDIEPAIDLLTKSYKPNPDLNVGKTLTTLELNISYDYRWKNGLKFMEVTSNRMPNLITEFINNDKFQEQMHLIILNNNKEFLHTKIEDKEFTKFFNKIITQLNKEQFNELYEKNNSYINGVNTPALKAILDSFHLENELGVNDDSATKRKPKI